MRYRLNASGVVALLYTIACGGDILLLREEKSKRREAAAAVERIITRSNAKIFRVSIRVSAKAARILTRMA